jgi:hypothetical protein
MFTRIDQTHSNYCVFYYLLIALIKYSREFTLIYCQIQNQTQIVFNIYPIQDHFDV